MTAGAASPDVLKAKVALAPRAPGVYLMKDGEGRILYVGKAGDLKSRLKAYAGGTDGRAMIPFLVSRVRDVELILTASEKEALILENTLIKAHRPRYNVDLRDDKAYVHLRIDPATPFPRFQVVRRPKKDGARYFGPYPSASAARETLRFLQSVFPLRTCRDAELKSRRRPCLEFEIRRCLAPCVGRVGAEAYDRLVRESCAFLEGGGRDLTDAIRRRMQAASEALDFEEAAALRDRIAAIEETLARQRMEDVTEADQDLFGLHREGDDLQVCLLTVRFGKLSGQRLFPLIRLAGETAELLSSLLKQFYDAGAHVPGEILLPLDLEDAAAVAEWLAEKKGRAVSLRIPMRGKARDLLEMARRNAENALRTKRLAEFDPAEALEILARTAGLDRPPRRIEGFDIPNLGGRHAVGSMVVFVDGRPEKADYRRFRVRTVPGADDYAMMYEVLKRRFSRALAGAPGDGARPFPPLPDLLLVDGGKGQLQVAVTVLKELDLKTVDCLALAKERQEAVRMPGTVDRGEDRVYLPRRREPLYLSRRPAALFLLQQVRDEAHRFAVAYHRRLKTRDDFRSALDAVGGIGPKRRRDLLAFFGSARRIAAASLEDLQKVAGVGRQTALRLRRHFNPEG